MEGKTEKPTGAANEAVHFNNLQEGLDGMAIKYGFEGSGQQELAQLANKILEQETTEQEIAMREEAHLGKEKNQYVVFLIQFIKDLKASIKEGTVDQAKAKAWQEKLHIPQQDES